MRSFVRLASLATFLIAAAAGAQAAPPTSSAPPMQSAAPAGPLKVAYLNSSVILQSAPGRAEAEAQLQESVQRAQQQMQRLGDSLKTMIDTYNKQEVILSPAAKEAKQRDIRAREDAYQRRRDSLQVAMESREQELVRPIMQQVQQVIDAIRAEEGYSLIFDVGQQNAVLVAADTSLDITQKVIARLKTMPPATAKTAGNTPANTPAKPSTVAVPTPAGVTRPKPPLDDR